VYHPSARNTLVITNDFISIEDYDVLFVRLRDDSFAARYLILSTLSAQSLNSGFLAYVVQGGRNLFNIKAERLTAQKR
jgi:hypothetical protein